MESGVRPLLDRHSGSQAEDGVGSEEHRGNQEADATPAPHTLLARLLTFAICATYLSRFHDIWEASNLNGICQPHHRTDGLHGLSDVTTGQLLLQSQLFVGELG